MIELSDKCVVITGAAAGIGRACAIGAASRGARVIVNDIDEAEADKVASEIRASGGIAVAHGADISDWLAAEALIERCAGEFGTITGLINNAGVFRMGMVEELNARDVTTMWEVNVLGTIACSHHALRHMLAGEGGSIINTVSAAQAGIAGMSAYGATKGAIASFTYTMAAELAGRSVRVNAISPRANTQMRTISSSFRAAHGIRAAKDRPESPFLNVPVYEYLLSDASKAVNGQIVRMNGLELSLCSHPQVMSPVLTQPAWTAELVNEAFRSVLLAAQAPLGM
ncbi:SDR family oxidoreductase [Phenylobacterium sp.]|uniref:SDR family NAD(P)-dependent oxidoreductase n=1 Tax=Phenylobacterium sp. TaxID=1871053 RepID=UPI00289E1EB3|nr:SDR family oxidoreductase [Phenylobacterium sp.]